MAPEASSAPISGVATWSSSRRAAEGPSAAGSRFGPYRDSRARASLDVRPPGSAPSAATTSASVAACQGKPPGPTPSSGCATASTTAAGTASSMPPMLGMPGAPTQAVDPRCRCGG